MNDSTTDPVDDAPFGSVGPMRIRHVINTVGPSARASLVAEQSRTLESIEFAVGATPVETQVEVVGVGFADEPSPADWLVDRWALSRSTLDVADFARPRRLPLLGDVLAPFSDDGYDLGVFTNVDIALQPRFYELLADLASDYDAFVINRRTVHAFSDAGSHPVRLAHAVGQPHPGHDCFVFRRELFDGIDVDAAIIGIPYVMRGMLYSLMLRAERFREFTDLHATYHLGDDRAWADPAMADYHDHNLAALRRVVGRLVADRGRDAVARLPSIGGHLKALAGEPVEDREWRRRPLRGPGLRSFDRRRLVFATSPGRSGSGYLASLLATAPNVEAHHEPTPTLAGAPLRAVAYGPRGAADAAVADKIEAIEAQRSALPQGGVYAETTHMFAKTFAEAVFDRYEHDLVSVVELRRPLREIVASMVSLGWFTSLNPGWSNWLIPPNAPNAHFRIAAEDVTGRLDLVIGYVLDCERRARDLRLATPDANWVEFDMSCVDRDATRTLFDALQIRANRRSFDQAAKRINHRKHRHREISAAVDPGRIDDALASFADRFSTQIASAELTDMFTAHTATTGALS